MNTFFPVFAVLWVAFSAAAFAGGLLAYRSDRARRVGRISTGLLMLVGGALFNALMLATGQDYSGFADSSWWRWVTDTWEAVLVPHRVLFIGLLVAYEAAAGILVLSGGRRTQAGLVGTIAFLCGLCVFGPGYTVFPVLMVPALLLLLRAERRAQGSGTPSGQPPETVRSGGPAS